MRAHIPLCIFGVIGLVSSIALLATFKPLYDFILEKVSWKIVHLFIFVCLLFTAENVCWLFSWGFDSYNKFSAIFSLFFMRDSLFDYHHKQIWSFMNSSKLRTIQFLSNFINQEFFFKRIYEITNMFGVPYPVFKRAPLVGSLDMDYWCSAFGTKGASLNTGYGTPNMF